MIHFLLIVALATDPLPSSEPEQENAQEAPLIVAVPPVPDIPDKAAREQIIEAFKLYGEIAQQSVIAQYEFDQWLMQSQRTGCQQSCLDKLRALDSHYQKHPATNWRDIFVSLGVGLLVGSAIGGSIVLAVR